MSAQEFEIFIYILCDHYCKKINKLKFGDLFGFCKNVLQKIYLKKKVK